jgi:protein SCO1/2
MNKIFKILVSITVAVMLIVIITPFVNDYKEHKQYNFTVDTIDGKITKDDFKGKVLAVYFGYTYCPDVCPTSLSSLAQALNELPDEKSKDVVGLFISVDPDRDTLKNIKAYAEYFHPNFTGATSTKENIDEITARYKAFYKKVKLENSAMGYSVAHTSVIYIFGKDGKLKEAVNHFSNPRKIKESLEKIL